MNLCKRISRAIFHKIWFWIVIPIQNVRRCDTLIKNMRKNNESASNIQHGWKNLYEVATTCVSVQKWRRFTHVAFKNDWVRLCNRSRFIDESFFRVRVASNLISVRKTPLAISQSRLPHGRREQNEVMAPSSTADSAPWKARSNRLGYDGNPSGTQLAFPYEEL